MANTRDNELIQKAQTGDADAFTTLLEEYYGVMFKMAFKWCGNREDAEDITQNACIKLARTIDTFRFKSAFTSWLYRLVINTAKDWVKADARHNTVPASDHSGAVKEVAEEKIYAQEVMEQVYNLPEKEKTALLLVMSEGFTHKETADIMECKESTVSWYIHEARKKLTDFRQEERRHG